MKTGLETQANDSANAAAPLQFSLATKLFLAALGGVALLYAVVLVYHVNNPMTRNRISQPTWLERCRVLCAQYGLISTGNLKADAEAYLQAVDSRSLSAPLQELLSVPGFQRAASEDHPLVGQSAPDFTLVNTHDQPITLSDLNRRGPVILVFYYGYYCSHCVAQLFGLQKDLEYIRELGAEVVAISADTPESTRGKYTEYGGFTFPVLSDQDYRVSEAWGVYVRPSINRSEDLLHGTFVIDRAGKVIFARRGYQPFVDNKSLLYWLADENGRGRSPSTTASPGFRRESR